MGLALGARTPILEVWRAEITSYWGWPNGTLAPQIRATSQWSRLVDAVNQQAWEPLNSVLDFDDGRATSYDNLKQPGKLGSLNSMCIMSSHYFWKIIVDLESGDKTLTWKWDAFCFRKNETPYNTYNTAVTLTIWKHCFAQFRYVIAAIDDFDRERSPWQAKMRLHVFEFLDEHALFERKCCFFCDAFGAAILVLKMHTAQLFSNQIG